MSTAILDPAETIAVAVRELYDQLRELVDRGPTDDPGLLDEIGKLTGRIRGRITRARKKVAAEHEELPVTPTAKPTPAVDEPAADPARPTAPAAVPATAAPASPATDRVTVRLAEPSRVDVQQHLDAPARGRHRRRPAVPRWSLALAVLLVAVGLTLAVATGSPLVLVAGGVAVAGVTGAGWRAHRRERAR